MKRNGHYQEWYTQRPWDNTRRGQDQLPNPRGHRKLGPHNNGSKGMTEAGICLDCQKEDCRGWCEKVGKTW